MSSKKVRARLLISVRDLEEALDAVIGGGDIIDFKEPTRGPLGSVSPDVWGAAAERFASPRQRSSIRLSAALGEAADAATVAADVPSEFRFAKVGPSGCRCRGDLLEAWTAVRQGLSETTELVGVAYADSRRADCLPPEQILEASFGFGLSRLLIDTYQKSGRSSVHSLGWHRLRRLGLLANRYGIRLVLAGSLRWKDAALAIRRGLPIGCFGIRGDVCQGGRAGRLSVDRVRRWQQKLEGEFA